MIKKTLIILALCITLLWHFLPLNSPPGFTADEAAFGYNAYSILQTGRDEYGTIFPLRLKSFGDYKLPLYTYLSAPIIKVFGLSEFSTRIVAGISALVIVVGIYFLTKALFGSELVSIIALYFATFSPWINTIARQAHETVLATALITVALYLLIRFVQSSKEKYLWSFLATLPFILFAYHTGKTIVPALFVISMFFFIQKGTVKKLRSKNFLMLVCIFVFALGTSLFLIGEKQTPAQRVKNLFILNNPDISLKTTEAKIEERFSPFRVKLIVGMQEITKRYMSYFSPEFLTQHGDVNNRFGYPNISPISLLEYLGFIVGLLALARKWKPEYVVLLTLLFVAPLNGALTWQEYTLTRVYPLIIVLLPLSAYGVVSLFQSPRLRFVPYVLTGAVLFGSSMSLFYYFVHYPKKAIVIRSVQAGYQELTVYIKTNYSKYDHFFITKDNGQPYIYLLFYLQYPPQGYQTIARLSPPDVYGFGQVEGFDKFTFSTDSYNSKTLTPHSVYVFSQDSGRVARVPEDSVKKIKVSTEEMFWIYENP